jgi:hypothetical protein
MAPNSCWHYTITVTEKAVAMISIESTAEKKKTRLEADAQRHQNGQMAFYFDSYPDASMGEALLDRNLNSLNALRGRYHRGARLGIMATDPTGQLCLTFDGLKSELGTRVLCRKP